MFLIYRHREPFSCGTCGMPVMYFGQLTPDKAELYCTVVFYSAMVITVAVLFPSRVFSLWSETRELRRDRSTAASNTSGTRWTGRRQSSVARHYCLFSHIPSFHSSIVVSKWPVGDRLQKW